jgi:hypothetical protein
MRNRERLAFRTGGFWHWMCCWRMYLSALQQSPILVVVAELASPKCQASVVYLCQPDHHTPSSFSVSLPAWPLFDSARPPRPSLAPGAKRQLKPASRSDAILSLPSVSARIRRVLTISRLVLIRGGAGPAPGQCKMVAAGSSCPLSGLACTGAQGAAILCGWRASRSWRGITFTGFSQRCQGSHPVLQVGLALSQGQVLPGAVRGQVELEGAAGDVTRHRLPITQRPAMAFEAGAR